MRAGVTAAQPASHAASFELERFEWTKAGTLEVAGRWFGIAGLRFMRPTLELHASDGRHRLLAVLEHKPWAAEDGERWLAAFPWDGDPVEPTGAELAVAPSLAVELLAGEAPAKRTKAKPRARRASTQPRIRASRTRAELPDNRPLIDAQKLREERDASIAACETVGHERDAALTAREAAHEERDRAIRERDALAVDRDAAVAARTAALAELESVLAERDQVITNQKAALRARKIAESERDEAKTAAEAAARQRDTAKQLLDEAKRERDKARTRADVIAPVVPDVEPPAIAPDWRTRLPAFGTLAILIVVVAAFVHGSF